MKERTGTANGRTTDGAKIGRSISGVEEPHVDRVEQVECLSDSLQGRLLANSENPGNTQIDVAVTIPFESVSRLNTYAVIVPKDITVGVEPGKLGEVVRCFQAHNRAQLEAVNDWVHVRGPGNCAVYHKAMSDVVR